MNGAVVFHCTAGKDRTGVLAVILLFRLGDLSGPNYCLEFVVAGIVGMIRTWVLRGFRESPEEMAELADRLILSGISAL